VLPIGISFYTFQTMSYAIDVFRGEKEPERDFVLVALYVSFFPQLVAGPIERAARLMPQLRTEQPFSFANLEAGGRLILWGLVKKLVVADRLAIAGYPPYFNPSLYSTGELAFGAASMFVVVYLDFSAYSDIAKGTAQLFGIRLVQNFRNPHAAGNIAEYWRRWHISMSDWVRDYLFRPLGGFRPRNLWHQSRTTLITMGLVGLWHGAQWTFVVWGLANGLSLVAYRTLRLYVLRRFRGRPFMKAVPWRLGSWTLTNFVRIAISILFFAPSFGLAVDFYEGLYLDPTVHGFDRPYVLLGFAAIFAFWLFQHWRASGAPRERFDALPPWLRGLGYATLAYVVVLGGVSRADQFIYYQF
jgi:D-alanyl-lipoteichoic acid acyltransferase DltB (MBOAT superfamily)